MPGSEVDAAGGAKAIADPRLGENVAGFFGFGKLDLFAKLSDVHAEILWLVGVGAPYSLEQSPVGEDLSGVLCEAEKEVELLGGEVDILSADEDAMLGDVDVEVSEGDDLGGLGS